MPEKVVAPFPRKNSNTSTLLKKLMEQEKPAELGSVVPTFPLEERIVMKECLMGMTKTMSQPLIGKAWGRNHRSRGSGTSSKSSTI